MKIKVNPLVVVLSVLTQLKDVSVSNDEDSIVVTKDIKEKVGFLCYDHYRVYHVDFKLNGETVVANVYSELGSDIASQVAQKIENIDVTIQLPKRNHLYTPGPC